MGALSARPMASLSSGLLARKGQARPAMRAQGLVAFTEGGPLDDLGWNDMGLAEPAPATPVAPPPVPPAVLVEREALREEVERPRPTPAAEAPGERGSKAAFTLRLDAHRHLRLRLASAAVGRSAQALVTEALDAMLAAMPQVEVLAAHLPPA